MPRVEHELTVAKPPQTVFDYLAAADRLTEWMGDEFERVTSEGGRRFRYTTKRGSVEGTFEWTEFEPPRRLAWRGERVSPLGPLGAVQPSGEYTLTPADGGTRVRAVQAPEFGGAMKLLAPIIGASIKKSWPAQLERMKRNVESGG